MKLKSILLLGLVALLTVTTMSCQKDEELCPTGYVEVYQTGSAKVIITQTEGVISQDLKAGQSISYNSCETTAISVYGLESSTSIRINGYIVRIQKSEAKDLTEFIIPPRN